MVNWYLCQRRIFEKCKIFSGFFVLLIFLFFLRNIGEENLRTIQKDFSLPFFYFSIFSLKISFKTILVF